MEYTKMTFPPTTTAGRGRVWSRQVLFCLGGLALAVGLRVVAAQHPDTLRLVVHNPGNTPQVGAQQGYSVATDGGLIVVGVPYDDSGGTNSGVAKVYDAASGTLLTVLPNPSPSVDDWFGHSVAVSGLRVVVGAPLDDTGATDAGSVYVFDLGGSTPTVPLVELPNPEPAIADGHGWSVAISGMGLVVGVPFDDFGDTHAGSAYIYDLSNPLNSAPTVTLRNPGPANSDQFGISVAMHENTVVVGTPYDNTGAADAGSVYVYDLSDTTPVVPVVTLTNPRQVGGRFGASVAISGSRIVVGVPNDNLGGLGSGRAYAYDLTSGTPTVAVATFDNPSPAQWDSFGISVSVSGTRVVVGSVDDDTGADGSGSAYVFDLASVTPAAPVLTVPNPEPGVNDQFGNAVSLSGTRLVVGAFFDDSAATDAGNAYVYDVAEGAVPVHTLNHPSPATGDRFGSAVAINGTRLVIGSALTDSGAVDAGAAYLYDLGGGSPSVPLVTLNNPSPAAGDRFGFSVATSGKWLVIGAPNDDTAATDAGIVHVYDLSSVTPEVPVGVISNPSTQPQADSFGISVAMSGSLIVIGSVFDDSAAFEAGCAYVYDIANGLPTLPLITLTHPDPDRHDQFGRSVALDGMRIIVGAPFDDNTTFDDGSAHIYDLQSLTPTIPIATLLGPSPVADDRFGWSVAVSGTLALVGAPFENSAAIDSGAAYLFDIGSATPTQPSLTLGMPNPVADDNFGIAVALSGTRAVIGVQNDDAKAVDSGLIQVYELAGATPGVPVATIQNPSDQATGDKFGVSIAFDGAVVVAGADGEDGTTIDRGAAYVFGPGKPEALQFQSVTAKGGGRYQMSFTAIAGGPLVPTDLAYLEAQGTSNVVGSIWMTLTNTIDIDAGVGSLEVTTSDNAPHQFFRIKLE